MEIEKGDPERIRKFKDEVTATTRLAGEHVALAFQLRAIPRSSLSSRTRRLMENEMAELELATDEALGRVEPD